MKAIVFHGAGSDPDHIKWLREPLEEFGYSVYAPKYNTLEEALRLSSLDKYDLYAGFSLGGAAALISSALYGGPAIAVGAPADRFIQALWLKIHEENSFQKSLFKELVNLLGTDPLENPLPYIKTSVIYYIERIKDPVLLIQGREDPIVRPFHSLILEEFLKKKGVRVEVVIIDGMKHAPAQHHKRLLREVIHKFLSSLR
ncbi:MAG: alpha/beta hydrolase family protein [Sulfolobales archaeon]